MKSETMTPEQFAYWLQGKVELHPEAPTPEQWVSIKAHLSLVFNKVTPSLLYDQLHDHNRVFKQPFHKEGDKPSIPQITC